MAEKDPAFLLYSKDWIQGTLTFSNEERGIYINLLCNQHQNNGLPTNTKLLARLVGMSEQDFLPHWEILKEKFTLVGDKLFNPKLESVMNGRSEYSVMRRVIGYFGALLKQADISENNKVLLKKQFDFSLFLDEFKQNEAKGKQNLKQKFDLALAKYANVNAIGNANEDYILKDTVFNYEVWTDDIINKKDMSFDELIYKESASGLNIKTDSDLIKAHEAKCIRENTTFSNQNHFRKSLLGYLKSASKSDISNKQPFIVTPKNN